MKFSKFSLYIFTVTFFLVVTIAGCKNQRDNNNTGNNSIKFDSARATEHLISLDEAIKFTRRYKDSRTRLDTFLNKNTFRMLTSEYFNRDAIAALLNQVDSSGGIRIYYGQDSNGTVKLVIVPATRQRDIITKILAPKSDTTTTSKRNQSAQAFGADGDAMERSQECPDACPDESPLMHDN